MMIPRRRVSLLASMILPTAHVVSANMVLRQLHVVTRQGSPTTIIDGDSNFPVQALSTAGEMQMEQLGAWIRREFQDNSTGLLDQYHPTRVRIDSSAYDTTIVSAQLLAKGLFPSNNNVPVFSQAARNDITIAAGDQCPTFNHQVDLLHLQQDMDWNEMESAYMGLLIELATLPVLSGYAVQGFNGPYVPLHSVWKVYDMIREAKVFCTGETADMGICSLLTFPHAAALLTDPEWQDLKTLVRYTEVQSKYGADRSSKLLASNLIRQIVERMTDDELNTPNDPTTKRVFVSSADYPTLIAIMTALSVEPNEEILDEVIPGYGSTLFVELYQDDQTYEHIIRILYKASGQPRATVLRMGDHCHDLGGCSLKSFTAHLQSSVLNTNAWCQACENDTSDLCLFYSGLAFQEKLKEAQAEAAVVMETINLTVAGMDKTKSPCAVKEEVRNDEFAAAFLVGMAAGICLLSFVFGIVHCCRKEDNREDNVEITIPLAKTNPKTPQTSRTAQSIAFWDDEPISPTASEDLEGDELSLDDNEQQEKGNDTPCESPDQSAPPPHSTPPSKQVSSVEIV
ncbi:expressed unknown protein [Seminavis robusta]|uniref:Uncharacterized protein n=1 Tax=Seminavis robusta TaxID=568900 RepID=A0A9N8EQQ7_9STRA|nr:expressed unknown protein [Seminavis robusta]|eukprot:Sro1692_g291490.1 n/a (569) ;mRNA; f:4665-6371